MKLGIIADTHDNLPYIAEAVRVFNARGADLVVHCGDFVAPFSLREYAKLSCEWTGVFGNNDGERAGLLQQSGGRIKEGPSIIEAGGRRIAVTHAWQACDADVICFGHTHVPCIRKEGAVLCINPGEAGGWLHGSPTVALLDCDTLEAVIIDLKRE